MHIPPVALKRKNHRLMLCTTPRKHDLLAKLISEHEGKRIAVAVSGSPETIPASASITVLSDDALLDNGAETFDLLISFDLPADPALYFARLALAADTALTLFDEAEQPLLLAIETLLGRSIMQERPEGFAPELPAAPKPKPKAKRDPAGGERKPREQRDQREQRTEKAPYKKEGRPEQKRQPKESGVSRYIGTDENGKPMFSGKTGERNHRKDGKPHDEESLAAKKEWDEKRKKRDGKQPYDAKKRPPFRAENDRRKPFEKTGEQRSSEGGEKKAYDKKKPAFRGEKKPYDAKKPPYRGENDQRKSFDKTGEHRNSEGGEKKAYDKKKPAFRGEKKPYDAKKPPYKGEKKPYDAKKAGDRPSAPGRGKPAEGAKPKGPMRRIKADDYKPTEPKK